MVIGLSVYLILLPKNECRVNTNYKNAVVYINDKTTNKLRLKTPSEQTLYNFYEFDVFLKIEESGDFKVTFKVECENYEVVPLTNVSIIDGVYTLTISGNTKTKLLTGVRIKSEQKLTKFKVNVNISITKI